LLSIIETAYLAAGPMLIMLLVYELMYNSKSIGLERERYKKRLKIIAIGILITACAALFYHVATLYIIKSYSTTSDYAVPPITRIVNFIKIQSVIFTHPEAFSYSAISIDVYGGFGLLSIVLGFGVSSLLNPIGSLIAYSPWIVEVFGLHNLIFASFASQYYGYIVGASFVSALLGLLVLFRYKKKISEMLRTDVRTLEAFVFLSMFVLALVTTVVVLPFGIKLSLLKLQSIPNVSISQIDTGLATIPENASVMTTPYIMPHLYYVRNLELTPVYNNSGLYASNLTVYWFVPDYIVVDRNLEDYNYVSNVPFDVYTYMGDNYTQYYNDSGLYIYKRKSS
jgi:hypothetical protein